ncbi:MAG: hypothetical protein FWD49_04100 [Firmicutes bacterium]|nr:hypothetical protein [Bacillota bacterium]
MKKQPLKFGEISIEEVLKRPKCFVGCHETLISASECGHKTDSFFSRSITYYGSGKNGNLSLNTATKHQQSFDPSDNQTGEEVYKYSEMHGGAIKDFFNSSMRSVLKENPDTLFLPWSQEHWILFSEEFWNSFICANDPSLIDLFGNKKNLKEFAKGKIAQADFEVLSGEEVLKRIKDGFFPNVREVAVQSPKGILGVGTTFFKKDMPKSVIESKAREINPKETYVVSEFIHNLGSPSVCALVSNSEVAIYPPWMMAICKDSATTAGSDLGAFANLPKDIREEIVKEAIVAGNMLKDKGYRGTANIDMMATNGETHPKALITEINTRDPETIALLTVASARAGLTSPHALKAQCHYAERTNFASEVSKLPPVGRKFYGTFSRGNDGEIIIPKEHMHRNIEGLDIVKSWDEISGTTRQDYTYTGFIFENK